MQFYRTISSDDFFGVGNVNVPINKIDRETERERGRVKSERVPKNNV